MAAFLHFRRSGIGKWENTTFSLDSSSSQPAPLFPGHFGAPYLCIFLFSAAGFYVLPTVPSTPLPLKPQLVSTSTSDKSPRRGRGCSCGLWPQLLAFFLLFGCPVTSWSPCDPSWTFQPSYKTSALRTPLFPAVFSGAPATCQIR